MTCLIGGDYIKMLFIYYVGCHSPSKNLVFGDGDGGVEEEGERGGAAGGDPPELRRRRGMQREEGGARWRPAENRRGWNGVGGGAGGVRHWGRFLHRVRHRPSPPRSRLRRSPPRRHPRFVSVPSSLVFLLRITSCFVGTNNSISMH